MLMTALNQRPFSRQFRCVGPALDGRRVITSHRTGLDDSYLRCTEIESPHPVVWNVLTWGIVCIIVLLDADRFVSFVPANAGGTVVRVHDAATGEPVGEARGRVPYWLDLWTTSIDRRWLVDRRTIGGRRRPRP